MFRLPAFGVMQMRCRPSDGDSPSGGSSRFRLPKLDGLKLGGLALLFLALFSLSPFSSSLLAQSTYEIEIDDLTALPGTTTVEIPVYLTNAEPLIQWQMGLDYDNLLLSISGVTTQGTASAALNPNVTLTDANGTIIGIELEYNNGDFPSGDRQLALYLIVDVIDPTLIPTGGSLVETLAIVSETIPIEMTVSGGTPVTPSTLDGSLNLYAPPVLRLGRAVGTPFDSEVRIPIELWSSGPSTVLEMGLDYDNLLLTRISLDGTALEPQAGVIMTSLTKQASEETLIRIEAPASSPIPQMNGDVVAYLEVLTGQPNLNFTNLYAGVFPILGVPSLSSIDNDPIANIFDGELEIEPVFVRGDPNFSGSIDVADVSVALQVVFTGLTVPCLEAVDIDDDGQINVGDAILLTRELFLAGSPPIPFPYPSPAVDPDLNDGIDCF